jgi:Flp pilus assembly protein TadD
MKPIEPPDLHWLNAAQGWLMLGNPREAWNEFAQIQSEFASHPEVLALQWTLLAAERRWAEAVAVSERHMRVLPADATAWVHRSFALHELKQTREALERLLPAVDRFPQEGIIPYNLACYSCQLGDMPAARAWLERAFTTDENAEARRERLQTALEDSDLQPLWPELKKRVSTHASEK